MDKSNHKKLSLDDIKALCKEYNISYTVLHKDIKNMIVLCTTMYGEEAHMTYRFSENNDKVLRTINYTDYNASIQKYLLSGWEFVEHDVAKEDNAADFFFVEELVKRKYDVTFGVRPAKYRYDFAYLKKHGIKFARIENKQTGEITLIIAYTDHNTTVRIYRQFGDNRYALVNEMRTSLSFKERGLVPMRDDANGISVELFNIQALQFI